MQWLKKAWRGEEKLWKVFWVYGIVGVIILKLVTVYAGVGLQSLIILLISLIYAVWIFISQWRCAFNASQKFWGYVGRFLTFLILLGVVLNGIFIEHDLIHLFHAAECRHMITVAIHEGVDPEKYVMQNTEYPLTEEEKHHCITSNYFKRSTAQ